MKDVLDLTRCNKTQTKSNNPEQVKSNQYLQKQTYLLLQCQMKEKPKI
jgi:hypothetical protein